MRARRVPLLVAVALAAGSCTATNTTTSASPTAAGPPPTSAPVSPPPAGATLADGSALPSGCNGTAVPNETVAFVADRRAWALDPSNGKLACLFGVRRAGAFAFGPQGDRVMLAG